MNPYLISRTALARIQALTPGESIEPGTFRARVSVFGNTDSYGDVVAPGAFTKTLAEWTIKGGLPPVIWSHQFADPANFLGTHSRVEETEDGLEVTGHLNLARPKAAQVWELMREGTITEFSFSGIVRDAEPVDGDDEDAGWYWGPMRLKDIDLWEAGPCFKGANPATELISVKTDARLEQLLRTPGLTAKAGRVLSQANLDALVTARDQIARVIEAAEATAEPAEPAEATDAAAGKTAPTPTPAPTPPPTPAPAPEVPDAPQGPTPVPPANPDGDANSDEVRPVEPEADATAKTDPKTDQDPTADLDPNVRALLELSTL